MPERVVNRNQRVGSQARFLNDPLNRLRKIFLARHRASDAQWKPRLWPHSLLWVAGQHFGWAGLRLAYRADVLKGWKKHMSTDKKRERTSAQVEERLRSLIAEHEARLAEIAGLVAHVRHEINNPLTGVLGQAQLLLREELSATARRRVETIEQLAGRIRDTVAQLRDIQRPPRQEPALPSQEETDEPPRN